MRAHLKRVADAFDGKRSGDGFEAHCPLADNHAHGDRDRSLTIRMGTEKPDLVLVKCGRGCGYVEVLAAVGLGPADCWPDNSRKAPGTELRRFKYHDINGAVLYCIVRGEANGHRTWKTIHPTDTGWKAGRGGAPVLYNLPAIVRNPDLPVCICEGERDADTIAACGVFVTTTVPFGSWKGVDCSVLFGRDVYVIVDNDAKGWTRGQEALVAAQMAGALVQGGRGDTIMWNVLRPPDGFKDATEYLTRPGNTLKEFVWDVDLFGTAPPAWAWEPAPEPKRALLAEHLPNGRVAFAMMPVPLLSADLDPHSIVVLLVLDAKAGASGLAKITATEIGQLLGVRRQRISACVKRLHEAGYVTKEKRGQYRVHNPARNTHIPSSSHKTPHTPENGPQTERSASDAEHPASDDWASDRTPAIRNDDTEVVS